MHYIKAGTGNYKRVMASMLIGSMVTFAVFYGPQPLIGEISREFGVSPSSASGIITLPSLVLAVALLFVPVFSDAWGRKIVMCWSLAVTSILTLLASFSPSFEWLVAFRLLKGISLACFPAVALTYLSEEVSPDSVGRGVGIYISGTAAGGVAGRVLASMAAGFFSWHTALLAMGLFSMVCSIVFWVLLPDSNHFQPRRVSVVHALSGFRAGLSDKKLLSLYGIGFLLLGSYMTLFNYLVYPLSAPPYNLSQAVIGLLFVFHLVGTLSSVQFGKWADRRSRTLLLLCGIGCQLAGSLFMLFGNIGWIIAGIMLTTAGFFAGHTVASGWVGRIAPMEHKSRASSLYLLFYYTGSSLVGWTGGLFLSAYGWVGVVLFAGAVLTLAAALLSPLRTVRRKRAPMA